LAQVSHRLPAACFHLVSGPFAAMSRCLLVGLATLLAGASAATLHGHTALMRRSEVLKDLQEEEYVDMCNYDYLAGAGSSDNCTDKHHHHILESEMCLEAARKLGLPTLGEFEGFRTESVDFYKRPRGCWKGSCNKAGGQCLFFNAVPLWPEAPIVGTPICRRPRLVNGTANTDGGNSSCPADYTVVTDETFCSEAADCLGLCAGKEFRVGEKNRSEHEFYPQGCFVHAVEGCVYLNPSYPKTSNGTWTPSRPVGMPICTVTKSAELNRLSAAAKAFENEDTATSENSSAADGNATAAVGEDAASGGADSAAVGEDAASVGTNSTNSTD